jgi:hypothetical protein
MNPFDVIKDFEALPWHDAKLGCLLIFRRGDEKHDVIRLKALMYNSDTRQREPMHIEFTGCAAFRSEVNLQWKTACGDAALEAVCYSTSPWMKRFTDSPDYLKSDPLLHFVISLIPPSGDIEILATAFKASSVAQDPLGE